MSLWQGRPVTTAEEMEAASQIDCFIEVRRPNLALAVGGALGRSVDFEAAE
jgi:hypothetical protein